MISTERKKCYHHSIAITYYGTDIVFGIDV